MDGGLFFYAMALIAAMLVGASKGGLPVVGMLGVPVLALATSPVHAAGSVAAHLRGNRSLRPVGLSPRIRSPQPHDTHPGDDFGRRHRLGHSLRSSPKTL